MGLVQDIWRDYLCRISPIPCAKPIDDAALIRAANSPYRSPRIAQQAFGLRPGASPEGIRTDAFGNDYRCCTTETTSNLPNTIPPDVTPPAPGGGAFNIPSPVKTEEIDQDEFRTTGSVSGPGFQTLLPAQLQNDIDVLEVSLQMSGASQVQLFVDATPISANYNLANLQTWSAPGLTVMRTQAVRIFFGATAGIFFEVRWKWKTIAP